MKFENHLTKTEGKKLKFKKLQYFQKNQKIKK